MQRRWRQALAMDTNLPTEGFLWTSRHIFFLTAKMSENRNNLLREVAESPSEIFKSCVDVAMGHVLQVATFEQEDWTRLSPNVSSSLNHFAILCESVIFFFFFCFSHCYVWHRKNVHPHNWMCMLGQVIWSTNKFHWLTAPLCPPNV